ncbi:MAG: NrfD/PsrC family molybdoenzyme membrane anchor subunit [Gordonibacter pamelaeae]
MDLKMQKNAFLGLIAACVVVLGLGAFGLAQQYSWVEGATSITMYVPWGLYITLFLTLEAIGAGALLFAALGRKAAVAVRIKLAVVGVVCAACAGLAIMPDLGHPLTSWRLFFAPNATSPLMLDVWLLCATLVFGVLLFVGLRWNKQGLAKAGSVGSAAFSLLLVTGTAIMFCSLPGKLGWESTSEIGVAVVQTLAAGASVALLLKFKAEENSVDLPKFAIAVLLANALLVAAEGLLLAYRDDFALKALEAVMFGSYAPVFWAGAIVGIVAPVVLFAMKRNVIASWRVLAGLLLSKFAFVVRGSVYPTYGEMASNISIPLLAPAHGPQTVQSYVPTMNEFFVAAAVLGLAVLLVVIVINSKLVPSEDTGDRA